MNTPPEISIIVPVYNVEPYLSRCLDSILNQTFTAFECILVDDCSPDNCPAICDDYARKDQRIRVIHKKQNEGLPMARKTGIETAIGEFIIHIDSDDWIEKEMLEKMYTKATNEHCDIVFCDALEEETGFVKTNHPSSNSTDKITLLKQLFSLEIHPSVVLQLIKRDLFLHVLFPQASNAEDWVITTQIIFFTEKIACVPIVFYHICFNPTSLSRENPTNVKKIDDTYNNFCQIIGFLNKQYDDLSVFDPELSNFINKVKLFIILNKSSRRHSDQLFELYPKSNQLIFNRKSRFPLYHKVFLFLATKKILFPLRLLDIFYVLRGKIKPS